MTSYLLEIGLEEMPAHLVTPSVNQLAERMATFLTDNRVLFDSIKKYSTPRRLAVLVENIAEKSEAMDEEVKGPSAKIAKDAEGNWSKAIQGFSRGQGLAPEDLELRGDYYYAHKHSEGVETAQILQKIGTDVISKMQFSTYMKWGNNSFLFVRPIQWLVSLLGENVVPFELLEMAAGRTTRGHRFLSNIDIEIVSADSYVQQLAENFVLVDADIRKEKIADQIKKLAADHGWQVTLHPDLLEEVNNIVEYPTAFIGNFDAKYLEIPDEVLITSMRDNQRYFELYNAENELESSFISVRNGNAEHIENVIAGNEKVLLARLEDAKFFWEEDQKLKIDDLVQKLDAVTFHAKIGSLREHMVRTKELALRLAEQLDLSVDKADIERAADIYKFDLLTNMVGEFAELQGVMGEKYAHLAGENESVAVAIREHYLPASAEGDLPETELGALLALADKLESLFSFFAAGLIPSGSNDPYALRRATTGVVRILEKMAWQLDLQDYSQDEQVLDFVRGRVQKLSIDEGLRHDIVEAAIHSQSFDTTEMLAVARAINACKSSENFKAAVEAVQRVLNITRKNPTSAQTNPELFEEATEGALMEAVQAAKAGWELLPAAEKFQVIVDKIAPKITDFFESVMVMADDEAVKNNRLALLQELSRLTENFADFNQINSKED